MGPFEYFLFYTVCTIMVGVPAVAYFLKKAENDKLEKEMNADNHK